MSRPKLAYSSHSKATYERFCKAHPEVNIPFAKWKEVIKTHNGLYRDYIIETGQDVKFIPGIGSFMIRKRKNKRYIECKTLGKTFIGLSCDFNMTRKIGKPVYHLNAHSDGYNYTWFWARDLTMSIFAVTLWRFVACRKGKRGLAAFAKMPGSPAKEIYKELLREPKRHYHVKDI